MTSRLYLYGIFPAPGPQLENVIGLDSQPVQSHTLGEFTFLFSAALQPRYLASRKNLLGHEKVLEAAMNLGYRTLLPLQFGLAINGWEQVQAELLTPHAEELTDLFQRLAGQREVSIKVLWEATSELELLMQTNTDLRQQRDQLEGKQLSMEQVIAIGQQIEAAMEERKADIVTVFRTALDPLASAVTENDLLTDAMIYNAAYLIPWDSEPQFGAAVEALDGQFNDRLRIRYNNFTAPYTFAQLT